MRHNSQRYREHCTSLGFGTIPATGQKEANVRFDKSLKKDPPKGLNVSFRFDILAQLANILARMTLYELLHPSKETREALSDALADSETFLT